MDPEEEISAIEKQFGERMAAETDAGRQTQLAFEREQAKNAVWTRYAEAQKVAAWKAEALTQFPRAFPGAVSGATKDEVLASAKAAHEFAEAQIQQDSAERQRKLEEDAKMRMYGRPGAGGGQSSPGDPVHPSAEKQFDRDIQDIQRTIRAGVGELSPVTVERAIRETGHLLIGRQIDGKLPDGVSDQFKEQ